MKITKTNLPFTIIGFIAFILLFIFIIVLLNNDCWKNHSKSAKKLGIPMERNVSAFFKEHQRFPTLKESELLFEKLGCSGMKQTFYKEYKNDSGEAYQQSGDYKCSYNSKVYEYNLKTPELNTKEIFGYGAYVIGFSQGNTHCSAKFYKVGELQNSFSCQQFSCGNKLFGSH